MQSMPYQTDWHLSHSGLYLMLRLRFLDGAYITPASTESVQLRTINADGEVNSDGEDLVVADVVKAELQKAPGDPRWKKDSIGYNLGVIIPAARLLLPGTNVASLLITPENGEPIGAEIEIPTKALRAFAE